jgi:Chaperone of endosialidase/YadA head domain repeat (2 copies)
LKKYQALITNINSHSTIFFMKKIVYLLAVNFCMQFNAIGQNVGIGTTNPLARLHVTDSSVLFSATGDIPTTLHNTPISKGGRRLMWYADKAAFRVGYAVYDEWDSINIGRYSVGMGYGSMATGLYSASIGHGSGASGISSCATGDLTNAIGDYSFTTGQYTTGKGAWSFASGYESTAKSIASIAMGNDAVAAGNYSVALGSNTYASGNYSYALGYYAAAEGDYSTSMGDQTSATGFASTALGEETNATSDYSTAIGYQTMASSHAAFAAGANTVASYYATTALGSFTKASNYVSVAMGDGTTASGYNSMAMGTHTTAGGNYSLVWGVNSNTAGSSSFILGTNLFDGGHKGDAMLGDTDPWNAGSVGSGTDDQMICRFSNGYYFLTGGNTNRTGILANHGDNSWSAISDSTKKEKVLPVNGEDFLHKISQFKLGTWNYKGQDPKTYRHYGPMAQDFHNAFGHDALGTIGCDTLINQQDFLGVSFIAIQALEKRTEKIEQQQKQITALQNQNEILIADNEKLQQQLTSLLSTVSALDKKVETLAAIHNNSNTVVKK